MGVWQVQSVLNRGELDPKIVGRIDLQQYYNGVESAKNVLCIPQGGLTKRPGQEYINTALDSARLENFSFNVEQNYLLAFTDSKMEIYKDDVLQTNISGSGNDYLTIPYTAAQIPDFDYIQSADTVIITHPDVAPQIIQRTSDTAWTIAAVTLSNIPQYDFNDALSPTPVTEQQALTFTNPTDGDRIKLSFNGLLTDEIVYDASDGRAGTAQAMEDELRALPNLGTGVDVAPTVTTTFSFQFAGESADNWDLIKATPVYVASTSWAVTGLTNVNGTSRKEDVWSATRGWPVSCTFHEGRLWFGGSKSRPQTLWGSVVNDFFNFETRNGLADESIEATLDTDQINAIESIFSNRSLQIFTAGAEFYVRESPITPENVAVVKQTNLGSKRVRPVTVDGVSLFVQRTGKAIYQFLFVDELQANQSSSISILAPHLMNDPIKMAVKRGSATSDANYVYILNDDGTLVVFNTLFNENIAGFTRWENSGTYKSIAVVDNTLYMCVEREINSSTVYYIEKEVINTNTDAHQITTGTSIPTVTVAHLVGETVKIKVDGAVRSDQVVPVGGVLTIDPEGTESVEVGLDYNPEIVTMPLNMGTQGGPNASVKKKIMRASVHLYESNGVLINGQRIADKTIGLNQFDAPEPNTGIERIFLGGWSLEAQLTITQTTPFNMTILNIGNEVKS